MMEAKRRPLSLQASGPDGDLSINSIISPLGLVGHIPFDRRG